MDTQGVFWAGIGLSELRVEDLLAPGARVSAKEMQALIAKHGYGKEDFVPGFGETYFLKHYLDGLGDRASVRQGMAGGETPGASVNSGATVSEAKEGSTAQPESAGEPAAPGDGNRMLDLTAAVDKMVTMTSQVEKMVSVLAGGYDVSPFQDMSAAVEAAARALQEASADEANVETFETAVDELAGATMALEGEVDDALFEALSSAMDGLETARDKLLAADDRAFELSQVMDHVHGEIAELVSVIAPEPAGGSASEPYGRLDKLPDELSDMVRDLARQFGIGDLGTVEEAIVRLEQASDALRAQPEDPDAQARFQGAAHGLAGWLHALPDQIDGDLHRRASAAVDEFGRLASSPGEAGLFSGRDDGDNAVLSLNGLAALLAEQVQRQTGGKG